ncbi:A/G-specific adenine glycosylase [Formosimonas limnophila]|uniref:Adenine DNA glycosylase n=1 Tax=Formosimonas limnophila TaxID=1384487 RepID=A0A8J3FYD5_9BURK|nr:A/G-specific adenine glycosylase [Formosimonas limnophila]GHA72297.1 A/G-specific adenine glycosylase [Formosimonas limnophila]
MSHTFAQNIILWQRQHGRHSLPWQKTTDAYHVWLSEIMLQQTQVITVMDYYERFLNRFPTVQDLARADTDDVLALWAGLGYYSRARNLHHCAKQVVSDFGGTFPPNPEQLITLKGIGASTAAAIAVFAYGYPAAILDGNVKRILCRYFGIDTPPSASTDKTLWAQAHEQLITAVAARDIQFDHATALRAYTQGLMDLGATLCTRSKPACGICPLVNDCIAYRDNRTAELPLRKTATAVRDVHIDLYIYRHHNNIWLEKRPKTGIWASLYSFPEHPLVSTDTSTQTLNTITHRLTHRQLYLTPHLTELDDVQALALEDMESVNGGLWLTKSNHESIGVPKPVATVLNLLSE